MPPGVVEAEIPDLDWAVYNYFPRTVDVRSRVRSVRFASVGATAIVMSSINFGWGGLVYEWSASTTGQGIDTSRNTPGLQQFEVAFWVSRYFQPFQAEYSRTAAAPPLYSDTCRADALFGESIDRDSYWRPIIFVPKNHALNVVIRNLVGSGPAGTDAVTLINIVLFTIEPLESYQTEADLYMQP